MIVFRGKSHIIIGTTLGLSLFQRLEVPSLEVGVPFFVGIYIGSLLPDVDCKSSIMGKALPIWMITKHRGLTHSLLFLLLPFLVSRIFPNAYYLSYGLYYGIASHIFFDLLTPAGCQILFPIQKKFKVPLIKTGGILERIMVSFLAWMSILQGYRLLLMMY